MKTSTKIRSLCLEQCANYDSYYDCCLISDKKCSQARNKDIACSYFETSVLPLDPVLHSQMTCGKRYVGQIRCKECGNPFIPKGHNHQYCSSCGPKVRKLKHRDYMRSTRSERGCA